MSVDNNSIDSNNGLISAGTELSRYIPEPKNSYASSVAGFLKQLGAAALEQTEAVAGIDPTYAELIERQLEMQRQMMLVTMVSNIERTKHETEMSAVRNLRIA